jgi:hypothetical protein
MDRSCDRAANSQRRKHPRVAKCGRTRFDKLEMVEWRWLFWMKWQGRLAHEIQRAMLMFTLIPIRENR